MKKIDLNKIKERDVSKEEIEKNEKESKRNKVIFFIIPIILLVLLAIIYVPTSNNILLIPIATVFAVLLYGVDCKQRTCRYCKKWNSAVVIGSKSSVTKKQIEKQKLMGKNKISEKKQILTENKYKCKNCGHVIEEKKIK